MKKRVTYLDLCKAVDHGNLLNRQVTVLQINYHNELLKLLRRQYRAELRVERMTVAFGEQFKKKKEVRP